MTNTNTNPMKKRRLALGLTQDQCAEQLATLTDTKPNSGRWRRLEGNSMATREGMTTFWVARILHVDPWSLIPQARKRLAMDRRNRTKRVARMVARCKARK